MGQRRITQSTSKLCLSLLKIPSEAEFERLRGISIESIRSGEAGCKPNVKARSAPDQDRKTSDTWILRRRRSGRGTTVGQQGEHSNTVESAFSLLKRGIYGTFHNVSRKHLHRYVAEFDFRWNARKVDDGQRTALAIRGADGKRLRYREPVAKVSEASFHYRSGLAKFELLRFAESDRSHGLPGGFCTIGRQRQPKAESFHLCRLP